MSSINGEERANSSAIWNGRWSKQYKRGPCTKGYQQDRSKREPKNDSAKLLLGVAWPARCARNEKAQMLGAKAANRRAISRGDCLGGLKALVKKIWKHIKSYGNYIKSHEKHIKPYEKTDKKHMKNR